MPSSLHQFQKRGKLEGCKLNILLKELVSDALVMELPDAPLEIQRGPYRSYPEIQREVERYSGCANCPIMDLV